MSRVELLKQSYVIQDHDEALLINAKYNELAAGEAGQDLLPQAITSAETELVENDPLSQQFGWEAVKKAFRWWNFREAFIQDLEPIYKSLDAHGDPHREHGLDPIFESFDDKLAAYQEEQDLSLRKIYEGSPPFIHAYAAADTERLRRDMANERLYQPLRVEFSYALQTLRETLDSLMDTVPIVGPNEEKHYQKRGKEATTNYYVIRHKVDGEFVYTIGQFNNSPGYRFVPDHPEISRPEVIYTLKIGETALSITADSPQGEDPTDGYSLLLLADNLLPTAE